jgi:hypothetical protein
MSHAAAQKRRNSYGEIGISALIALPACYQRTPYPECWVYSPECVYESADEGGSGDGTSSGPTSDTFPTGGTETGGDDHGASSGDAGASSGESSAGTTGPEMQAQPVIVGMSLTPGPGTPESCVLYSAGPVAVTVQTEDAIEVWITVDDGEAVALEPVGDDGTEFVGEIAVLGESWNGSHTVSAVAESGELVSAPRVDMFTVEAPAAGSELWKKKSTITPSRGNAVAVDAQGEVYELFTEWNNPGARCHVRRRDTDGESVWPQDAVALAAGVSCGGEDIEVAPDGTIWVLTNTVVDEVNRWQLFHLDPDGELLDAPQIGDFQEFGRGLDVNAAGDLLLCGTRPGFLVPDAWVRLTPSAGKGWTVPWVYKLVDKEFDERTGDCAFVEDRVVVVGEAFGKHDENELKQMSRGFVVEFGVNGAELSKAVATASPWQSGYGAVAPDGDGGYVAVGYTCDAKVTPCTPTQGVVNWFSLGASLTWGQPVTTAATVWGVAASPSGGVVVAAEALIKGKGFLTQEWALGQGMPSWAYQGTLSTLQAATGIAVGPYGYILVGGYFLDGDTLAAGVVTLHPY